MCIRDSVKAAGHPNKNDTQGRTLVTQVYSPALVVLVDAAHHKTLKPPSSPPGDPSRSSEGTMPAQNEAAASALPLPSIVSVPKRQRLGNPLVPRRCGFCFGLITEPQAPLCRSFPCGHLEVPGLGVVSDPLLGVACHAACVAGHIDQVHRQPGTTDYGGASGPFSVDSSGSDQDDPEAPSTTHDLSLQWGH